MSSDYDSIPAGMKEQKRWMLWKVDPTKGNKPPIDLSGYPVKDWAGRRDNGILMTFDEAEAALANLPFPAVGPQGRNAGLGFADASGIDMDNAVQDDGSIDPRAEAIISAVPGWVERSHSGKGLKVYFNAEPAMWIELDFKQTPLVAQEKAPNYFACTGIEYRTGDPLADGTRALKLVIDMLGTPAARKERKQVQRLDPDGTKVPPGGQEQALFREACRLRRNGWQETEIAHGLWGLVVAGRFPAEQGKAPWTFRDCEDKARSACRFAAGDAPPVDFETNKTGGPLHNSTNIGRAISALNVQFFYDEFKQQKYTVRNDGDPVPVDDPKINELRFEIDRIFKTLFPKELFHDVLDTIARANSTHPVREYLNELEWDGTERLGKWLVTYGYAKDSAYTRAVGRIVLKAAVKRIFNPGCMFQELLVLESPQGYEKSSALRALCPDPTWFTDSMPLGVDAKVAIERSAGIWIVEASEMLGHSKKETDDVKGFLSRETDGPVRLAYGRETVSVPRQWIAIGTTNAKQYLKDSTGGRRFWPVPVGRFDVEALKKDRDQIWAEAMFDLKQDDNVRLNPTLWGDAKEAQDARAEQDDWHDELEEALGVGVPGRVTGKQLRALLDLTLANASQYESSRIGGIMRRLGFERKVIRAGERVLKAYVREDPKRPGDIAALPWLLGPPTGVDENGQAELPGEKPF